MVSSENNWAFQGHPVFSVMRKPDAPKKISNGNEVAVLLIHGFGASTSHWRYNIPEISKFYEVHAIDLLGFGKSSKPGGLPYGGSLWRDQVVKYVKEVIKKPTVLIGNSLGGYAALAAGAELAENSAGVVLLNAAGYFSEDKKKNETYFGNVKKTIASIFLNNPLLQRIIFENLRRPKVIRRTLNQVYINKKNVNDELVESIRLPSLDHGAFRVFKSVFNPAGPQGKPLDELFCKLKSPLLLLWGNRDPWMNAPGKRETYRKYTPKMTSEVVLDAGHCPHDEIPEKVNQALLGWLGEL